MTVVDASFVTDALVAGGRLGDVAQERLGHMESLTAPHLLCVEVISAVRRLRRREEITASVANGALDRLTDLRVSFHGFAPFQARVWELRSNATPYDAWYLAVSEAAGEPLVTTDAKLAGIPGARCEVQVVRPS